MDSQITFEQIEETALRFALMMGEDDLDNVLELSNSAMNIAIEWHELRQTRLGLFYANPESRKDWIKASERKISTKDVGTGTLQKETSYWIVPRHDDYPIFAKHISFDGIDAEFETPDKKGSYSAKEILIEQPTMPSAEHNQSLDSKEAKPRKLPIIPAGKLNMP